MVIYSEVVLHCLPCKPEARSTRRLVHLPHTSTQSEFCLSWNVQEYTKPYAGPNQRWCILSRWHVVESTQLLNERYVRNLQLCGCALGLSNQFLNFSIAFFEFLFPIIVDYIEFYSWLHRVLLISHFKRITSAYVIALLWFINILNFVDL